MSLLRQSIIALLATFIVSAPAQTPMSEQEPQLAIAPPPVARCTLQADPASVPDKPSAHFPSYLNDSLAQLKTAVPALRGLKFDPHPISESKDADPALVHASETLIAMLPRVPNLIAKEELSQAFITVPYITAGSMAGSTVPTSRRNSAPAYSATSSTGTTDAEELQKVLENMLDQPQKRTVFSYRIRFTDDPVLGPAIEEYRIDSKDQSVKGAGTTAGNPRSVGFSNTWMLFTPDNLRQSHFRYLGTQKIGKHETVVIAFAQLPETATMLAEIGAGGTGCRYLTQGILWIDQSQFQIVRLQTDLVEPLTSLHITRLRSDLHFSEVKIPQRSLTLWLPEDVKISWQSKDSASIEIHRYSNYRLFSATSRIILPDPE